MESAERLLYYLGRPLMGLYARALLEMDVTWHCQLPEGPVILAANHPSTTDPFLMVGLIRRRVSILIEERMFRVPLFGRYLRRCGHVPVPPANGRAALEMGVRLLEGGRTLAIFPEGAISPLEGGFHRPHTGAARLALAGGVPIVPIGIHIDRTRIHCIPTMIGDELAVGAWYFRGPYAITVGRAMRFEGSVDDHEHVRAISDSVMQRVIQLSGESTHRATRRLAPAGGQPLGWPDVPTGGLR